MKAILLLIMLVSAPPADQQRVQDKTLADGLLAIRGHMKHVNAKLANKLVREAREVLSKPGNSWLPIHILLGMAINESDLRHWLNVGLDCGLTQNNIHYLFPRWKRWRQWKLCHRIKKSSKLSFEMALLELNKIKRRYCGKKRWFMECLLNVYNQGNGFLFKRGCRSYVKGGSIIASVR